MSLWTRRVPLAVTGCALGFSIGCLMPDPGWFNPTRGAVVMPMPYRVPARQGMADLRLAMVHDVVTERYVRHGPARDQALRAQAEQHIAAAPDDLDAYDDAALAAERLGDNAAAAAVMRRKAERQGIAIPAEFADIATIHQRDLEDPTPLTLQQQQQYRTYANLGTVLLHGALPRLLKGEREALPAARSGMACLEAAIRLDPGAHFGRERWQLVIAHHLLLVSQDPAWLRRCDAVGNDLRHIRSGSLVSFGFADDVVGAFVTQDRGETQDLRFTPAFTALDFDAQATLGQRKRIRYSITPLTPDVEWISAVKLQGEQIALEPFDLPVLGILGMWTLGGGANPHFALALGTIMEQVGQGALAWECYERTAALAPNYSADPETRQWLIGHLVQRQQTIAGPRGGEAWESAMRSGFQQELSTALAVRSEFHQAEAARIAAGGAPMDAIADAEFWSQRPPLASQPGREDELAVTRPLRGLRTLLNALVTTVMGGALFALFSSGKRPRVRTSRST